VTYTRITWCNVKIITPDLPHLPTATYEWDSLEGVGSLGILTNVSVQHGMQGVNSFTLSFAPEGIDNNLWTDRIPQYSLVFIDMGSDAADGDDPTVMVGLTGPPSVSEDFGSVSRQVSIPGRGVECVMADAGVWLAPWLDIHDAGGSLLERVAGDFQVEAGINGRPMWIRNIFNKFLVDNPGALGDAATNDPVTEVNPLEALVVLVRYYLDNEPTSVVNLVLPPPYIIRRLLTFGELGEEAFEPGNLLVPDTWSLVHPKLRMPQTAITPREGPVMGMIEQVIDRMFHDFFIRYEDGKARMQHRVKPFNRPIPKAQQALEAKGVLGAADKILARAWDETVSRTGAKTPTKKNPAIGRTRFAGDQATVKTLEVTKADLLGTQLRKGMTPIYNAFYVLAGQIATVSKDKDSFLANIPPVFSGQPSDFSYVGRFGIRGMKHESPYMMFERGSETDIAFYQDLVTELAQTLQAWFDPHPEMLAGTIQVVGRAEYRCGHRLLLVDDDGERPTYEYHVTSVSHSYSFADGSFVTSLGVERGWRVDGAPAAG